ncbi:hypothetical protein PR048_001869 [Dryococelus australis]|uniref:DUF4371 domain-containing protein n=1 Tax=Dryococelus australis TaxID=614101 RepID=A0ABQ9IIJ6_9NEOP|nr:hypothetical protein PR048_001869 [Dryococelus australis]
MFDCTPDVSNNEQMITGITGDYLTQTIMKKLKKDGLEIRNCRGQSYENSSNMVGVYKAVQARILENHPQAM